MNLKHDSLAPLSKYILEVFSTGEGKVGTKASTDKLTLTFILYNSTYKSGNDTS